MTGDGGKHDQSTQGPASGETGRRRWRTPRIIVSVVAESRTNPPNGPTIDHTPFGGSDLGQAHS
jgi:hypothetical protein